MACNGWPRLTHSDPHSAHPRDSRQVQYFGRVSVMPVVLITVGGSCEFRMLTSLILIMPSAVFRRSSLCLRGGNTTMTRLSGLIR
jgi:hypothetical protein